MKCEKIDTHRTYTQLQKKRTTYMYLLFSKISICDNYVICGYIALKVCMQLSKQLSKLSVKIFGFFFTKMSFRGCKKTHFSQKT